MHCARYASCIFHICRRGLMVSLRITTHTKYLLSVALERVTHHFSRPDKDDLVLTVEDLGEPDESLMAVQEEDREHWARLGYEAQLQEPEQQIRVAQDSHAAAEAVLKKGGRAFDDEGRVGGYEGFAVVGAVSSAIW